MLATKLLPPALGLMFVLIGAWLGVREPELDQGALVALFGG